MFSSCIQIYILSPDLNKFSLYRVSLHSLILIRSFERSSSKNESKEFWQFCSDFVKKEKFRFIYSRFTCNENFYNFTRSYHTFGIHVVEFPTYPFYEECKLSDRNNFHKLVEQTVEYCDYIFTPSKVDRIFKKKVFHFSNDIVFTPSNFHFASLNDKTIRILCIANFRTWHGFDRLLIGLADYIQTFNEKKIILDFYGEGQELQNLKDLARSLSLNEFVNFSNFTDFQFFIENVKSWSFGISSLGLHRIKIDGASPLKSRDYFSIGIPFVTTCFDNKFRNYSFSCCVPSDESPVDFRTILKYFKSLKKDKVVSDFEDYCAQNQPWESYKNKLRHILETTNISEK